MGCAASQENAIGTVSSSSNTTTTSANNDPQKWASSRTPQASHPINNNLTKIASIHSSSTDSGSSKAAQIHSPRGSLTTAFSTSSSGVQRKMSANSDRSLHTRLRDIVAFYVCVLLSYS
uniref:Cytospin-A n=1 Tax=Caenorhabditis tropicalis TaxID=1561998 RepID=A0A1I7TDD5_9PELO